MKIYILLILLMFSGFSYADTYPAVSSYFVAGMSSNKFASTAAGACSIWNGVLTSGGDCNVPVNQLHAVYFNGYSCPAGGTVSGTSCINAPACSTDQNRNSVTDACQTPPTCTYPSAYDNPSNSCITPACPSGQSRLPAPDYTCVANPTCPAIIPLCASTAYDCNNGDGTQQHIVQCSTVCPAGQHLEGKDCIDNKTTPVACPAGFVARNGGCEAADPVACPAGTRSGKVNGETVCVGAGNKAPQSPQAPEESHNTGTGTQDGTTTTVQRDANGVITGTTTGTTTGTMKVDLNTTGLATELTNKGILNALTGDSGVSGTVTPADSTALDTASTAAFNNASLSNPSSYFVQSFVVLPSASCVSVPFHYKALQYDFDPCIKLQSFRDLLGYFFYIITVIFIYQTLTRPAEA